MTNTKHCFTDEEKAELGSNPYTFYVSDYSNALVTKTFFLDAPVHIVINNHAKTQVYDSTFSNGNVGAVIGGRKTTVQFDDNCKFHNIKYKLLDQQTVISTYDKAILNLLR